MPDSEIVISSEKSFSNIMSVSFAALVYLLGAIVILGGLMGFLDIHSNAHPILIIPLIIWNFFGFLVLRALLWVLKGQEIITFSAETFSIRKRGLLFSKPRSFYVYKIKNLKAREQRNGLPGLFSKLSEKQWFGISVCNSISFVYDGKIEEFGTGLGEIQAWGIVQLFKDKFPFDRLTVAST